MCCSTLTCPDSVLDHAIPGLSLRTNPSSETTRLAPVVPLHPTTQCILHLAPQPSASCIIGMQHWDKTKLPRTNSHKVLANRHAPVITGPSQDRGRVKSHTARGFGKHRRGGGGCPPAHPEVLLQLALQACVCWCVRVCLSQGKHHVVHLQNLTAQPFASWLAHAMPDACSLQLSK